MLALHLLQSRLVYVNTLMIQRVLEESRWRRRLKAEDRRGLTPLFYVHVNPYGRFDLDTTQRLDIGEDDTADALASDGLSTSTDGQRPIRQAVQKRFESKTCLQDCRR